MQIVPWTEWLDQHIPYYEKQKQVQQHKNPPASVLVVDPVDRNRRIAYQGFAKSTWESMDVEIQELGFESRPLFLDTDTHQRWYWGFWNADEALMAIIKLA